MKHEIIELHDVQIIGMAKKIAFNEAKEECPKFWGEYVDEGGMKAFQEQYTKFHKEWVPAHPEYTWATNSCCMEWYLGTDIQSPDYQCGVMMPLE